MGLCGCVNNRPVDVTAAWRETVIPPAFKTNIRPTLKLVGSQAQLTQMGNSFLMSDGKVFHSIFTGDEQVTDSIDLVSSRFDTSVNWLGGNTTVTYTATVAVTIGGERHVITGTGSDSTRLTIDNAARTAVEGAVMNIVRDIRMIQQRGAKT
jgi:hypothetical protein